MRPSEEYRTPTDQEWTEFLGHFERRKVSVGTCGRAFGTPCIHEHACVCCPMLWPDPAQRNRLVEIRDNLIDRIAEAEREGWLGEVEGLQVSLASAHDKLAQLDGASATPPPWTWASWPQSQANRVRSVQRIRNLAIGILRARGHRNIAAALRRNARDTTRVLPLLAITSP